jgi:uncharacterized protein YkwD
MVPRSAAGPGEKGGPRQRFQPLLGGRTAHAMTRTALTFAVVLATALTTAPAVSAEAHLNGFEREVIDGINAARGQQGLPPVRAHRGLSRAADTHSRDMLRADFFDHASSDGTSFDQRVRRFTRARMVGETIAALRRRQGGAGTVVQMWLESPPHRAIVLEPRFRRVGIARRFGTLGAAPNAVVTADFSSG